ncbi:MAG: hypothetical protein M5T61_09015 [Acidimicrobiia bacterium]|nr:hypothetical protein [Acidimicrobiia bacterium]
MAGTSLSAALARSATVCSTVQAGESRITSGASWRIGVVVYLAVIGEPRVGGDVARADGVEQVGDQRSRPKV